MPLARLAAHRAATPALLRAIERLSRPAHEHAQALLTNPNTPRDIVDDLTARIATSATLVPPALLCAAATRMPATPATLEALASGTSRSAWISALAHADSAQLDALIHLARLAPATRHTVVPAVLDAREAGRSHVEALGRVLSTDPQPLPAARTWLSSLLGRYTGPGTYELAHELAILTADPVVRDDLLDGASHAAHRSLVTAQVIAGAAGHTNAGMWLRALDGHDDHDGALANAALDASPTLEVATHVARNTHAPTSARVRALVMASDLSGPGAADLDIETIDYLTEHATPDQLTSLASHEPHQHVIRALLRQPDAPTAAVDACWAALRRASTEPRELAPWVAAACAALAMHPSASAHIRAQVASYLSQDPHDPPVHLWPQTRMVLDAWVVGGLDAALEVVPAALLAVDPSKHAGVGRLVDQVLDARLASVGTEQAADALVHLVGSFTGTLHELVTTASAVGS